MLFRVLGSDGTETELWFPRRREARSVHKDILNVVGTTSFLVMPSGPTATPERQQEKKDVVSSFTVNVRPPSGGEPVPYKCTGKMTVKMLKAMIEAAQEVPVKDQELLLGDYTLLNRQTLKTVGLKDGRRN